MSLTIVDVLFAFFALQIVELGLVTFGLALWFMGSKNPERLVLWLRVANIACGASVLLFMSIPFLTGIRPNLPLLLAELPIITWIMFAVSMMAWRSNRQVGAATTH